MNTCNSPKGFDNFTCFRSRKFWDWRGAKPDVQLHLAFQSKLQDTTYQRFVFTDKYVAQVLNNIANSHKGIPHHNKLHWTTCAPSNFATFLRPINAPCL